MLLNYSGKYLEYECVPGTGGREILINVYLSADSNAQKHSKYIIIIKQTQCDVLYFL
jgi:hypothetical protein